MRWARQKDAVVDDNSKDLPYCEPDQNDHGYPDISFVLHLSAFEVEFISGKFSAYGLGFVIVEYFKISGEVCL